MKAKIIQMHNKTLLSFEEVMEVRKGSDEKPWKK